jgi:hypothetical protein
MMMNSRVWVMRRLKRLVSTDNLNLMKILAIVTFECIYEQSKTLESHGTAQDSDGDMACTEEIHDLSLVL